MAPGNKISNRHYLSAGGQTLVLVSTTALPTLAAGQIAPTPSGAMVYVKLEVWHKDHLGSIAATTDHDGAVTGRCAYDPFGKRRLTNGRYDDTGALVVDWAPDVNRGTDLGFTGHEQLDDLGVIHMNGRIYDPLIGRFMQADPLISEPLNLQAYDRYGYCGSNPLTCTDPSGYSWLSKTWKKLWNNKVVRTVIIVAAAYYTGGYALDAYATAAGNAATSGFAAASAGAAETLAIHSAAYTAASTSVAGGAIAGAAGGFTASFIASNGDFKAGAQGAVTGAVLGGVSSATANWQPAARVAAKVGASATVARTQGGSSSDAAWYSLRTNLAGEAFRAFVGWDPSAASGRNQAEGVVYKCGFTGSNCYIPDVERGGQIPLDWKDTNVIGLNQALINGDGDFLRQGGSFSQVLNRIPGLNAVAQFHDTIFNLTPLPFNLLTNVGTMLPAAYLTYDALSSSLPADKRLCPRCQP